jgi:Response regulator containing CheY-like receiver, AAA-type ATPase, and DNA-binding domains
MEPMLHSEQGRKLLRLGPALLVFTSAFAARFLPEWGRLALGLATAGAVYWAVSWMADKTVRSRQEECRLGEELLQSQKMAAVGQLSSGIAHEINTPLAVIGQEAELLLLDLESEGLKSRSELDGTREGVRQIALQVERCREITHKLLSLSRKLEAIVQDTDVNALAEDMALLVEKEAGLKSIVIHRNYAQALPPAATDPGAAAPGDPESSEQRHAGRGLPGQRDREHGHARPRPGAHHRGRHRPGHLAGKHLQDLQPVLHHQAARTGHGSRAFHVPDHHGAAGRNHPGRQPPRTGRPLRGRPAPSPPDGLNPKEEPMTATAAKVLVVDDEERFGQNMVKILEANGLKARHAADGEEALAEAARKPYDVILLDMKMAGLSGKEVLRRLGEARNPAKVVVLTGHASVDDAVELINMGAYDYLLKPCKTDELLRMISLAFEQRQVEQRNLG